MLELRCHRHSSDLLIVAGFCFGRWDVADRLKQASVIKPIHPFKRGEFNRLHVAPWCATVNNFCLVKAVDRFGEGVIV